MLSPSAQSKKQKKKLMRNLVSGVIRTEHYSDTFALIFFPDAPHGTDNDRSAEASVRSPCTRDSCREQTNS